MYWWEVLGGIYGLLLFLTLGFYLNKIRHLPSLKQINKIIDNGPLVSIIVPVKNEADTIEECLSSLINLKYKSKEIIVVLGESTDGSEEIVRKFSDEIKIIREPPLPDGWIGKNWACYIGYQNSSGGLLLFTDGDTSHDEYSLSKTVSIIINENVDMITLFPKFIFRSLWEKLITPLIAVFIGF
ncbi:MAG: glycosyltransferase family 2 protein [Thermoprotei archaeon]